MTLFLDFDGPILDVAERYHRVHQDLVGAAHAGAFTTAEFWELKRNRTPVREILQRCGAAPESLEAYSAGWLREIEAPARFGTDVVHPGVADALREWCARHRLVLVTLRQDAAQVRAELERFRLAGCFSDVLVGDPRIRDGWQTKATLIRGSRWFEPGGAMAGDTEIDLRAARLVGLKSIGVLSGIRNRRLLELEKPDHLLDKLVDLPQVLAL